jgi:hypothetical protein
MHDYIPRRDANAAQWAQNFAQHIAATPAAFGLTAGDAATITAAADAFAGALLVAVNEATRTRATVAAKDAARAAMEFLLRHYAQRVRLNRGVSNQLKASLGITIDDTTRTPVGPPVTCPIVTVIGATMGRHMVRFADSADPERRGKPAGVVALQLFVAVANQPAGDVREARFAALVTRDPFEMSFEHRDNARIATYFARWQTRRGIVGPWSAPAAFTVAA